MRYFDLFEAELPMDQASRMMRAKKLGFTTPAYHGTNQSFNAFIKPSGDTSKGNFFADNPDEASGYATGEQFRGTPKENGNVIPVLLRIKNPLICDIFGKTPKDKEGISWLMAKYREVEEKYNISGNDKVWPYLHKILKKEGYDALFMINTPSDIDRNGRYNKIVIFDPKNIRSIFAVFDPANKNSTDLNA